MRAHGRRAELRQVDLTGEGTAARLVGELADALGRIDVLINNAGTGGSTPFLEVTMQSGATCWRSI